MTVKYVDTDTKQTKTKVMRGATSVMGRMNYLGTTWSGADYALNTDLLRNEWGFNGFLISDMVMNAGSNSVDQALRSGTDRWMAWGYRIHFADSRHKLGHRRRHTASCGKGHELRDCQQPSDGRHRSRYEDQLPDLSLKDLAVLRRRRGRNPRHRHDRGHDPSYKACQGEPGSVQAT